MSEGVRASQDAVIDEKVPFSVKGLFIDRHRATYKRAVKVLLQLALVIAVYGLGCLLAEALPIDVPGNIAGMALLLILLGVGLLKVSHIDDACDYLISHMSIFFIPAGVGIMGSVNMLEGLNAVKFLFVCLTTTVIVFLATSATVVGVSRIMSRRAGRASADDAGHQLNREA